MQCAGLSRATVQMSDLLAHSRSLSRTGHAALFVLINNSLFDPIANQDNAALNGIRLMISSANSVNFTLTRLRMQCGPCKLQPDYVANHRQDVN